MKRHRLMIITHDLAIGGLQRVVVTLCRHIDREKFDTEVLCLRSLGEFTHEILDMGIDVKLLEQKQKGTDYLSFLKVAKVLRDEKVEIIHTHNTFPFVDGVLASLMTPRVRTVVHTDHARDFPDKKRYMFAEWFVSHFAYRVVGVSAHTSRNLSSYEKIDAGKIVTIPNGIDGSRFLRRIDRQNKRRELSLDGRGPVLGLGVRLAEQKGISFLLEAMARIREVFPDVALLVAGEGPLEEDLRRYSLELGVERNVFFLGPRLDIHELLQVFDLYVLPSLWEGLPMVILEAFAAGCPVVATNVGGNPFAIEHGDNGSLVPPGNPDALASEILRLLGNPVLRQTYADNGRRIFNERFSGEVMTRQYERLYLRNPAVEDSSADVRRGKLQ